MLSNSKFLINLKGSSLNFSAHGWWGKEKNLSAETPTQISPKENSGASGGFLPKPLLLRLRLPNSKKISRVFCEILSPKNSFRKTESALVPPPARTLGGQNAKKNVLSFLEEIGRAQIRKARNIFLWCPPRLCEGVAGLIHSFSFRSKKVRAKCIITAPVVTCSELRIWSDFAEAKIAL